jgi:hypothetical protein
VFITSNRLAVVDLNLRPVASVNRVPAIYAQDGAGNTVSTITGGPVLGGGCDAVDCTGNTRVYAIVTTKGNGCVTWWQPDVDWNMPHTVQCGISPTSAMTVAPWDYPDPNAPTQTVHSEMVITGSPVTASEYTAANQTVPAGSWSAASKGVEPVEVDNHVYIANTDGSLTDLVLQ